jgi:hypothetical protein
MAARQAAVRLNAKGDDKSQVAALQSLCEALSFGSEKTLALVGPRRLVPTVFALLGRGSSPYVMLLATRACSMIAEHSGSCNALVQHGAIEYMCTKLTAIEYID